ncbi:DUF4876 domain-containing protein [Elizabethkingia miricola]|uniref:DUF4876 domain-containing protein n=1 Tax=Elizabethkingia miricola TaxID=172045 RepID=A0ABD5B3F3_ELIMR|nr:DUF4876 domain-containing protein [Elizabethkingia miricola]MDQ8747628.1 DUF4876 domain-containing protein [Elizabethkingia miricola]OPB89498.1 DUF4876 domain-containing protein [Elizabethkingia miricola]
MKKLIFLLLIPVIFLIGCNRSDDFNGNNEIRPMAFTVTVKFDNASGNVANKGAANAKVVLVNTLTRDSIKGNTDANGELKLNSILPGTYNVTSELKMTKDEYQKAFGQTTSYPVVNFGGFQEKVTVNANVSSTVITVSSGNLGDLVIKQIYYAGSSTSEGAAFRDQFIEIHNNSDQTIYADGLYVALMEGNTNNNVTSYTLTNGQYDWSQTASGGSSANTDYAYASSIIKIPGNGTQYPILPGKSIVIAQTAINHKAPFDGNDGKQVTIKNPSLTVDLSKADFEVYVGDYAKSQGKNPYQWDIQNIMVPDMEFVHWVNALTDYILNLTSKPAVAIISATPQQVASWAKVASPKNPKGSLFVQVPASFILDGVDITDKEQKAPKDLPTSVDATRTFTNKNGLALPDYSSYSVIRKTKEIINGRVVLQDTNNSANDFITIEANPRGYAQ